MPADSVTEPLPSGADTGAPEGKVCAFKEWSLVCDALEAGDQSLILRKGGIHEGKSGFWWRHNRFYLFPTHFHEQAGLFQWTPPIESRQEPPEDGRHLIRLFAEVDFKAQITDWAQLEQLRPFHYWSDDTLRERFEFTGNQGISLAFLRVFRVAPPWTIEDSPAYGGCRSWLNLPAPTRSGTLEPVLTDAEHAARRAVVHAVVFPEPDRDAG